MSNKKNKQSWLTQGTKPRARLWCSEPSRKMYAEIPKKTFQTISGSSVILRVPDWKAVCGIAQGSTSKILKCPLVSQIDVAPHMWDYIISKHFFCALISLFPFQWKMSTWLISCRASNILINSWTIHNLCVRSGNFYSKISSSSQMHIQGKAFLPLGKWWKWEIFPSCSNTRYPFWGGKVGLFPPTFEDRSPISLEVQRILGGTHSSGIDQFLLPGFQKL